MKKFFILALPFLFIVTPVLAESSSVEVNLHNGEGTVKVTKDGEEKLMEVKQGEDFYYDDSSEAEAEQYFGSDDAKRPKFPQNTTSTSAESSDEEIIGIESDEFEFVEVEESKGVEKVIEIIEEIFNNIKSIFSFN